MNTLSDLKQLRQWVAYTPDKIPICPATGRAASSNNPATWATAAEAWRRKSQAGLAGIGFVFTIEAGIVGIDLDKCIGENGELSDFASYVVSALDSYTEYSPSGRGLHVLVKGTIPQSIKREDIEIYNELRYFTITGRRLPGSPETINERQSELDAVWVVAGGDFNEPPPLPDVRQQRGQDEVTEQQIEAVLNVLPKWGDYNTYWLPILMAVHDAFPDNRGVRLIENWSPGKRGEVRRKFASFDRTAKGGIGIGTLFHIAKEHGWKPPQQVQRYTPKKGTNARAFDLRGAL